MTEGNGHVIDPNGDARRALQEAVAEHGPEVLSDAAILDTVCREQLTGLPGESILIGNAARTNIPALLSELIPRLGNYGAIQSAAVTLAGKHNLDMAASLWVVREYARALGYIASGPATGTSTSYPGSGPRPVPGSGPVTGVGEGSGPADAGREAAGPGLGGGEAGSAVAEEAAAGAVAGAVAGEAGWGESAGSKASTSGAAAGGDADGGAGDTSGAGASAGSTGGRSAGTGGVSGTGEGGQARGEAGTGAGAGGEAMAAGAAASGGVAGQVAAGRSYAGSSRPAGSDTGPASGSTDQGSGSPAGAGQRSGSPQATGPIGGSPVGTGPIGSPPAADGSQGGAPAAGGTGGSGPWGGAPGGDFPQGEPGFPLPLPAGRLPGRQRSKALNRNMVGIAAAVALVAGYLGVAAVAHLSPFPAKTPPAASSSQSSSPPASASSSPASSPDPSPPSQFDILMTKIPAAVRNQNNRASCLNAGTRFGATAVSQCQQLQGLAANTIIYYLFPSRAALASGFSKFLATFHFHRIGECTTGGKFTDFIVNCQSDFTIKTPGATGSIAEYPNKGTNSPIIVSTDNQQKVMAVMVGTNDGDLLAYWNRLDWVVTS